MAKRPRRSIMDDVDQRRADTEEVAALLGGGKGTRTGRASITEREARAIRSKGGAKNLSRTDRDRLYAKTKKASDERRRRGY